MEVFSGINKVILEVGKQLDKTVEGEKKNLSKLDSFGFFNPMNEYITYHKI